MCQSKSKERKVFLISGVEVNSVFSQILVGDLNCPVGVNLGLTVSVCGFAMDWKLSRIYQSSHMSTGIETVTSVTL